MRFGKYEGRGIKQDPIPAVAWLTVFGHGLFRHTGTRVLNMNQGNPEKCRPFLSTGSKPVFEPFFSDVVLVYKTERKKSSKLLSFHDYNVSLTLRILT
jgi:hypothetical protein